MTTPNSGHVTPDLDREKRIGFSEVIYCPGKTDEHLREVGQALFSSHDNVLATRATAEQAAVLQSLGPDVQYNAMGRIVFQHKDTTIRGRGPIAVVSAGTTDVPVAEEAACTAEVMGNEVHRVFDVGVAGIHRILSRQNTLEEAEVVIVVAGMEGALPSVVGGLISRPIIAVPTSVGYGASLQGIAALLGMLNSCAPGVTVVNIDNGFGAAYAASRINRIRA
jgi:NCAIR mutase (PurE)-related protein